MIKKLLALLSAGALALCLAGCGGQVQSVAVLEPSSSGIVQEPVADTGYDDNLDGLCGYLAANNLITGDPVEMSYREIGAIAGCRYSFRYNKGTVQAEFYEFDLDNLDAKGKECVDSVKEKGFFVILNNEVRAKINGKYLMIYSDTSNDEVNAEHTQQVEDLFMEFKK